MNMKIYLSIPKGTPPTARQKVTAALINHTCNWFRGGAYHPRIVTSADTTILLLNGPDQTVVGKGQYSEGNLAALEGQKIKAIYYDDLTKLFNLYEIDDMKELGNDRTWKEWASIDLIELAKYTAIELNDYYNNYENI